MQVRVFAIPMDGDHETLEELNVFLRSQKVLSVEKVAAVDHGRRYWSLCVECVEYLPRWPAEAAAVRTGAVSDTNRPRLDYREILSKDEFDRFAKLRAAQAARRGRGVPVYTILTNAQLADLARNVPQTKATLGATEGLGPAKLDRYGEPLLALLRTMPAPAQPAATPLPAESPFETPGTGPCARDQRPRPLPRMKRAGNLYAAIAEHDNLRLAFHSARRGKQDRSAVQSFAASLDAEIEALRQELLAEKVQLRGYRFFLVHDPKPRRIAAPAFRDRVLHHAILQVVEPELERIAIHDSYACRKGKGLHKAIARAQEYCRRHPFFLQLDVRKFFDSVDQAVLRRLLARRFKAPALLHLFTTILDSYATEPGKGLPIGSLTSQHFANFYLAPLDHFVKETLRVPGYVRYMDDFVLFADDRERLRAARDAGAEFLRTELRLDLKHTGVLDRTTAGVGFLGLLVRPSHLRLMGKTKRRVRRKLQRLVGEHACGVVDAATLSVRATALLARTRQVKARGLRERWIVQFAGVEA